MVRRGISGKMCRTGKGVMEGDTRMSKIKCPYCGSVNTARYIYGHPLFDGKAKKKIADGKWAHSGCCIAADEINGKSADIMPARICNDCRKKFASAPILMTPGKNTAEDYRDIVTAIRFSVGGFLEGTAEVKIRRNRNCALVTVNRFPGEEETEEKQITRGEWQEIVNTLYGRFYLHEWKKEYVDSQVMDGTQWELDIYLSGRRVRQYYGINDYPPYWPELMKMFQKYAKL